MRIFTTLLLALAFPGIASAHSANLTPQSAHELIVDKVQSNGELDHKFCANQCHVWYTKVTSGSTSFEYTVRYYLDGKLQIEEMESDNSLSRKSTYEDETGNLHLDSYTMVSFNKINGMHESKSWNSTNSDIRARGDAVPEYTRVIQRLSDSIHHPHEGIVPLYRSTRRAPDADTDSVSVGGE